MVTSLPAATTSVSNLPTGCTYDAAADVVTCDVGDVAAGDDASVTFKANLGLLALGLPLNATTEVTSGTVDPDTSNNSGSDHCVVATGLIILC